MQLNEKIKKCLKEGQKGERHKGIRRIKPSEKLSEGHIRKAIHNFNAMGFFHENGYSDWSASAAFYSLYHCLLGLLAKKGYESRNQNCTFAVIESLIDKKEIAITKNELKEIFDSDVTEDLVHSDKILDIRERMQYSMQTSLNESEYESLRKRTKTLFDKIRQEIEKE
jgi:uncharacterized protein (UPF0332 family)